MCHCGHNVHNVSGAGGSRDINAQAPDHFELAKHKVSGDQPLSPDTRSKPATRPFNDTSSFHFVDSHSLQVSLYEHSTYPKASAIYRTEIHICWWRSNREQTERESNAVHCVPVKLPKSPKTPNKLILTNGNRGWDIKACVEKSAPHEYRYDQSLVSTYWHVFNRWL